MDEPVQNLDGVGAGVVLCDLADQMEAETRTLDKIDIQRASDQQFMVRMWFVGESEYETQHLFYT